MNQPQRKLEETYDSAVAPAPRPAFDVLSDTAGLMTSPARALQAKLHRELESEVVTSEPYMVLKAMTVFAAACAGTWVFGALLYLQV